MYHIQRCHRQTRFDIFQFTNAYASSLVAGLFLRIPYVLRLSSHRANWNRNVQKSRTVDVRLCEWLENVQVRKARHVFVPSHSLRKIYEEESGILNLKVIPTPIYVEIKDWDPTYYEESLKGKPYLLYFGALKASKGLLQLADVLPHFLNQHPEALAVCIGKDTDFNNAAFFKTYLEKTCSEARDRLVLWDPLPHKLLYPIVAKAKLVVLPSLTDNLPNTCLESMALGRPVIGTHGTSFDELITDEKNGFLIHPGDSKELLKKLEHAWSHPELERIGEQAKERIKALSPDQTVHQLLNYYLEVMGRPPLRGKDVTPSNQQTKHNRQSHISIRTP